MILIIRLHTGVLYDNVAGVTAQIDLQLRDYWYNKLISGGRDIELALLGVGSKLFVCLCLVIHSCFVWKMLI